MPTSADVLPKNVNNEVFHDKMFTQTIP